MGSLVSSPTLSINRKSWNPEAAIQYKSKFNTNQHSLYPYEAGNYG